MAPKAARKRPAALAPGREAKKPAAAVVPDGRIEPFSQRRCVREMLQLPNAAEGGNPLCRQNLETRNTATRHA